MGNLAVVQCSSTHAPLLGNQIFISVPGGRHYKRCLSAPPVHVILSWPRKQNLGSSDLILKIRSYFLRSDLKDRIAGTSGKQAKSFVPVILGCLVPVLGAKGLQRERKVLQEVTHGCSCRSIFAELFSMTYADLSCPSQLQNHVCMSEEAPLKLHILHIIGMLLHKFDCTGTR